MQRSLILSSLLVLMVMRTAIAVQPFFGEVVKVPANPELDAGTSLPPSREEVSVFALCCCYLCSFLQCFLFVFSYKSWPNTLTKRTRNTYLNT